jgi:hypothetical protein
MPALLTRPAEVLERMRWQGEMYRTLRSPSSYWQQAFVRAEWDLPLEAPEVGVLFTAWAAGGLVLLARHAETRRFAAGAAVLMATLLAAHLVYPFQAFRNLLPLAALGCVAAGHAAGRLADRLVRPRAVALAALGALALLYAPADLRWARTQRELRDSRLAAVDWVAARLRPGDRVLVQGELAVLPSQLARLGLPPASPPWPRSRAEALRAEPRFLVIGELVDTAGAPVVSTADRRALRRRYRPRVRFGDAVVGAEAWFWRGNHQRVTVWERRARRRALVSRTTGSGPSRADSVAAYAAARAARPPPRRPARTRHRGSSRGSPRTRRARRRPSPRRG